jgi:hypothetical protein
MSNGFYIQSLTHFCSRNSGDGQSSDTPRKENDGLLNVTGESARAKDGYLQMEPLNCFVTQIHRFNATSKSKEQHPLTMETGRIGVKDGVHIPESAQKSQPPSNGKKANALNVDFTSMQTTRLKYIIPMEIIAIPKWKI